MFNKFLLEVHTSGGKTKVIKINVNNVFKVINEIEILNDINIVFEGGNIYGIYGHNGSGKTMLFRTICGLIKPSSGSIEINGKVLHRDIDFPQSIGVLIENPNFWKNYTGMEVLETLASIKNTASKNDLIDSLKRVGLDYTDKRVLKKYSLGMKQRLGIAQAIMEKPDIIILDEPTNALDENGVNLVYKILEEERNRGAIILISSHNKEDIERLSNYKIKIDSGKIIEKIGV